MDYIKAYNEILESYSKQIDVMNFIGNKLSDLNFNDIKLERRLETLKDNLELQKNQKILLLKEINEIEILMRLENAK